MSQSQCLQRVEAQVSDMRTVSCYVITAMTIILCLFDFSYAMEYATSVCIRNSRSYADTYYLEDHHISIIVSIPRSKFNRILLVHLAIITRVSHQMRSQAPFPSCMLLSVPLTDRYS